LAIHPLLKVLLLVDLILTITTTVSFMVNPQSFFSSLNQSWPVSTTDSASASLSLLFYMFQGRNFVVSLVLAVTLLTPHKLTRHALVCSIVLWCFYCSLLFYRSPFFQTSSQLRLTTFALLFYAFAYIVALPIDSKYKRRAE